MFILKDNQPYWSGVIFEATQGHSHLHQYVKNNQSADAFLLLRHAQALNQAAEQNKATAKGESGNLFALNNGLQTAAQKNRDELNKNLERGDTTLIAHMAHRLTRADTSAADKSSWAQALLIALQMGGHAEVTYNADGSQQSILVCVEAYGKNTALINTVREQLGMEQVAEKRTSCRLL